MELELDSRILEGKKPLNCFDTEQAWQFIGKQCYFSDDARDFMNLDKADGDTLFYVAELQNIWTAEEYCFADNSNDYRFILPLEWVKPEESKEPEKKYRPFSLEEFTENHFYADSIIFRRQDSGNNTEEHSMYLGYETAPDLITDAPGNGTVLIGNRRYRLQDLYDYYEIFENGKWQPFGTEVKEKE